MTRHSTQRISGRRSAPLVEALESRQLLSASGPAAVAPAVVLVSQRRYVNAIPHIDPEADPGIAGKGPPTVTEIGHGFSPFYGHVQAAFDTGKYTTPQGDTNEIQVAGAASQDSKITTSRITASGFVSAHENDTGQGANSTGSSNAYISVTFRVVRAVTYHLNASVLPGGGVEVGSFAFTKAGGSGPVAPILVPNGSDLRLTKSGQLQPGTYTLTEKMFAVDGSNEPAFGTYSLDLQLGGGAS